MPINLPVSDDLIVTNKEHLRELLQEMHSDVINQYGTESPATTLKDVSACIGVTNPVMKKMLAKKELPGVERNQYIIGNKNIDFYSYSHKLMLLLN